jgi:RNA polymerase sigma-70 factor (ECF subfamily)
MEVVHENLFSEVYNEYWELMYKIANKKTNSHDDALDIVQETFTYIWQQVDNLAGVEPAKIRSYLITCLYYRILDFFRRRGIKNKHLEFFRLQPEQVTAFYDPATTADAEHELQAINIAIMGELDKMPDRMKAIFMKSHFDDISVEDLAREYNMPDKTVRNQISIARKRLRSFAQSYPVTELTPLILLFLIKES